MPCTSCLDPSVLVEAMCSCCLLDMSACNDTLSHFVSFIPLGKRLLRATFDYSATYKDELTLKVGDNVEYLGVTEDEGWYKGQLRGKIGGFPSSFVEELPSSAVSNGATSTDGTQLTSPPAAEISPSKPPPPIPSEERSAAVSHHKDSTCPPKGGIGVAWALQYIEIQYAQMCSNPMIGCGS